MISQAVKKQIRSQAQDLCEYCRLPQSFVSAATFHIEHIISIQHGGEDELDNICLSCPFCNMYKGPNLASLDPLTKQLTRLYHPRKDTWLEHFEFQGASINGLTEIGRTTVFLLKFNDEYRYPIRLIEQKFQRLKRGRG
jgi:hypothetical protein